MEGLILQPAQQACLLTEPSSRGCSKGFTAHCQSKRICNFFFFIFLIFLTTLEHLSLRVVNYLFEVYQRYTDSVFLEGKQKCEISVPEIY